MAKDLSAKIIINAEDRTRGAFGQARAGLESISTGLGRLQDRLNIILGAKLGDIIAGQIGEVIKTADAYKSLDARLNLVSDSAKEYGVAQKELFNISQRSRADLGATTDLYGRIETSVKSLGGSQKQALEVTETINKAIALTGPAAESSKAGIIQFIQGLDGGALRGQEFNSVMEQTPGLARALADGLGVPVGKLREMAEAGELTADRLINALGKAAPKVAEQFNQLPVTVGQAMTQLNNAWTVFIGNTDKSLGITGKLASGIQKLSQNLDQVADVAVVAAEVMGARFALGLGKSAKALVDGAIAARQKTLADIQAREASVGLLRQETILAGVKVKSAKADVESARLQSALAVTEKQRAQGLKTLELAYRNLHKAIDAANAKQAALDSTLSGSAEKLSKSEKSWNALNGAVSVFAAYEVGKTVGEWLNQFELVRQAGTYLSETFVLLTSGLQGLLSGQTISDRFAEVQRIHAEFEQIRANQTANAQQDAQATAAAEQAKTQAIEQAAQLQAESFKRVQAAAKELTAGLDAEAKTQTAAIQQALAERTAAIDALDVGDAQKDQLRLQAKIQAGVQELQIQQTLATEKLNLIDAEYSKEIASAQANKDRLNQVEFDKRQAKLGVYQGLAQFYQGEIDKLQGVYSNEINAAAQAHNSLQTLELNHQHALREIERLGFDEKQKQDSLESEYEDTLLKLRQEQAKGKQASQQKINELLSQAKNLHGEITTAAVNSATTQQEKRNAIYDAQDRLNGLYKIEKAALKDNEAAYKQNAEAAKQAIDSYKDKLADVNKVIGDISEALQKEMRLKIGIDQGSLATARDEIAELTKPETKVITIQTVGAKGGNTAGGDSVQTAEGVSGGGFARGGEIKPFEGFLPGYGGGDRRHLLAEDGEFVVRKEAVRKIGVPVLEHYINKGVIPSGSATVGELVKRLQEKAVRRASGGLIDDYEIKRKRDEEKNVIERALQNIIAYGSSGTSSFFNLTQAQTNIGNILQSIGRTDLYDKVSKIVELSVSDPKNPNPNANFAKAAYLRDKLLNEEFNPPDASNARQNFSIPQLPDAVTQFANQGGIRQGRVIAPEVIKLDLSFNGKQATGTFDKSSATQEFLDEIKRAGFASR